MHEHLIVPTYKPTSPTFGTYMYLLPVTLLNSCLQVTVSTFQSQQDLPLWCHTLSIIVHKASCCSHVNQQAYILPSQFPLTCNGSHHLSNSLKHCSIGSHTTASKILQYVRYSEVARLASPVPYVTLVVYKHPAVHTWEATSPTCGTYLLPWSCSLCHFSCIQAPCCPHLGSNKPHMWHLPVTMVKNSYITQTSCADDNKTNPSLARYGFHSPVTTATTFSTPLHRFLCSLQNSGSPLRCHIRLILLFTCKPNKPVTVSTHLLLQ